MNPELEAFIPLIPPQDLGDPLTERENIARLAASFQATDLPAMEVKDVMVPGTPDVPVRVYRPQTAHGGAIVWLHGGGWCTGDLDTEHVTAVRLADASGALVVSVGYRLAPEDPFPAALDDGYSVLTWLADHAGDFGADPARIAVGGMSAGGNIAAALTQRTRDEQGPPIRFQLLNQPALDDRLETASSRQFTDLPRNDRRNLEIAWQHYLGSGPASPYAAPARATNLSGLPPAYIACAELDTVRDDAIRYALRLLEAGVSVELHQWPGTFHGSHAIGAIEISQRQNAELAAALRRGLLE